MAVLDDLSGFEFEDVVEDIFRNLGYENVRQADRRTDKGRDVLMEEDLDPKDDPYPIELIDGEDLREIADDVGLDLYNGRIEILCDETPRPYDPAASITAPLEEAVGNIQSIDAADLPKPHAAVTFQPVVEVTAETNTIFETPVGVVHRINERTQFVIYADRGSPRVADSDGAALISENLDATVDLDDESIREPFDEATEQRFGQTETEYKDWAIDQLQRAQTTTVTYTGDNNVTYNKTCEPNRSNISVQSIEAVYVPEVRQTANLDEYTYLYEHYAAGPSRVTTADGFHWCVHCETADYDEPYAYCENCGAIAYDDHIKTERLTGEPVYTGCAVTETFAFKTKYFYDEANQEAFREEYAAMGPYEKAMENPPLGGGRILVVLVIVVGILVASGVV